MKTGHSVPGLVLCFTNILLVPLHGKVFVHLLFIAKCGFFSLQKRLTFLPPFYCGHIGL